MKIYFVTRFCFQIGKLIITGENGMGICPKTCFTSEMSLVSVTLLSDVKDTRMMLSSNKKNVLQSGFITQYQPIRQLPQSLLFNDLQLDCVQNISTPTSCRAVVTYFSQVSSDTKLTLCGTDFQETTYCTTKENEKSYLGKYAKTFYEIM